MRACERPQFSGILRCRGTGGIQAARCLIKPCLPIETGSTSMLVTWVLEQIVLRPVVCSPRSQMVYSTFMAFLGLAEPTTSAVSIVRLPAHHRNSAIISAISGPPGAAGTRRPGRRVRTSCLNRNGTQKEGGSIKFMRHLFCTLDQWFISPSKC